MITNIINRDVKEVNASERGLKDLQWRPKWEQSREKEDYFSFKILGGQK